MQKRKRLLFISTRFLFPVDSGGKIRTTQVLRGMKDGEFDVTLVSPASIGERERYAVELASVCDRFESWPAPARSALFHYTRGRYLASRYPIPVATDQNRRARKLIAQLLDEKPDVVVFDFLHAAVLAPGRLAVPSVLFTHNVEAEIFARHLQTARNPFMKALWRNQHRKMEDFERSALRQFDVVVAVSARDSTCFAEHYDVDNAFVIPTGVDLDYFSFSEPVRDRDIVFCGSMDWLANQDAIGYFLDEIWPRIIDAEPEARLTVVGRSPPQKLLDKASAFGSSCRFTGFVDDVRAHLTGAAVSVIPMRIGGGTRLKAYEALALGTPLVSTSIGVEGLPLEADKHFLLADDPQTFAEKTLALIRSRTDRTCLAKRGRRYVETHFSYQTAARSFEAACNQALDYSSAARAPDAP